MSLDDTRCYSENIGPSAVSCLRTAVLKPIGCSVAFVFAVFATPSVAVPIYELTGTLNWVSTSGADRLILDGEALAMSFEITDATPNNVADPNGTQSWYQGLGALSIGGENIDISSSFVSFFSHSNPGIEDVANFFLWPASGDPEFYYPAVGLIPESNAGASIQPPLYSANDANRGSLLVSGADPSVISTRAAYSISPFRFTSNPVPEPSTIALASLGLAGLGFARCRKLN